MAQENENSNPSYDRKNFYEIILLESPNIVGVLGNLVQT